MTIFGDDDDMLIGKIKLECPWCKKDFELIENGFHMESRVNMVCFQRCGCCGKKVTINLEWFLSIKLKKWNGKILKVKGN